MAKILPFFNKLVLLGNLTRDPQLSYLPSNTAVVEFALAITRKYYAQDNQLKEEVCFIDCRAYGKSAENLNKFCKKGNPLFIEGRLTFDSWTAKDGSRHSKHRVTVESFQLLGGKPNKVNGSNSPLLEEPSAPSADDSDENVPF